MLAGSTLGPRAILDGMERAKAFASVAGEYERGRPGYPPAAIEWLLGRRPLDVVDVGAGTGKLTAALVAAGHRVVAVEPLAEMRERLAAALPDVAVVDATAEQTTLPDHSADAVVAGAAFHWFDADRALPEVARILRPPGVLGLLGNGFDDSRPWVRSLTNALGRGGSRQRRNHWPADEVLLDWFADVEDRWFAHEQPVTRVTLLDLVQSYSRVAVLDEGEREALLERVAQVWEDDPELGGRDAALLPWRTRVRRCQGLRGR